MKQLIVAVFAVGGAILLGGCESGPLSIGAADAGSSMTAVITGLHLTTASAFPQNPMPTNVDVTLSDPASAQAVYDATIALPPFTPTRGPGPALCGTDFGYSHPITFMTGTDVARTAILNTGGCQEASISGLPPDRKIVATYWSLLAKDLGIEESTLFTTSSP